MKKIELAEGEVKVAKKPRKPRVAKVDGANKAYASEKAIADLMIPIVKIAVGKGGKELPITRDKPRVKGNYPFAILHEAKSKGYPAACILAQKLCREEMTVAESKKYVDACLLANGDPNKRMV